MTWMRVFLELLESLANLKSSSKTFAIRDLNTQQSTVKLKVTSFSISFLTVLYASLFYGWLRTFEPIIYMFLYLIASTEFEQTGHQRKGQMRKSIKYLFGTTPKFQKTMKRGVYLGCLFFHESRILVTNDDNLPIVEIDESHPSSSWHTDFHWLHKISCTWEDVKVYKFFICSTTLCALRNQLNLNLNILQTFRLELEKSQSSSSAHFRSKLLHGVEQLQTALGTQDLGQPYFESLKDSEGTTIICCVKQIADYKSISNLSVRWIPLAKFRRKTTSGNSPENSDSSIGMTAIRDLLHDSLQVN